MRVVAKEAIYEYHPIQDKYHAKVFNSEYTNYEIKCLEELPSVVLADMLVQMQPYMRYCSEVPKV